MRSLDNHIIITVKEESKDAGIGEVFTVDPQTKFIKWLDTTVALIEIQKSFTGFAYYLKKHPPIYLQHINPVQAVLSVVNTGSDLDIVVEEVKNLFPMMARDQTFSVQTRFAGKIQRTYKQLDINKKVSDFLEKRNFNLDIKNPQQVISIVFSEGKAYIGISPANENISNWAGGRHRFAYEASQVTRSEFKLLEVIDIFGIALPLGRALDIGAAPGGWTRVLLEKGMEVTAVDSGELREDIAKNPKVIYLKETIQEFLQKDRNVVFDVLVNDMRMDSEKSAYFMLALSKFLRSDGIAIMTLKLPEKGFEKKVKQTRAILEKGYKITHLKQLFHNRSEVTAVLQKSK